jgi:pSer/pThr/pTyr-binding forkhead associated (FHA) protein
MGIWLVMQTADGIERSFPVCKPRTIIGREVLCDVRVAMPAVSARHCELVLEEGRLRMNDLDSARGTFHNGESVREALLVHEDRLTVGPVTFIVRISEDHADSGGTAAQITIIRREQSSAIDDALPLAGLEAGRDRSATGTRPSDD